MKAPIAYIPRFVEDPAAVFEALRGIDWERRPGTPRCEYYCNDHQVPYTYGRGKGIRQYMPKPYIEPILRIRRDLEELTGDTLDVCFLNMYLNQSDHLGWHSDDSPEMDDTRPIVTVSLGVPREIWFRPTRAPLPDGLLTSEDVEKVLLETGSACVMKPGMQDEWQHRIPKSSAICGERISLTFRGYVKL